jgi:hypothetical protein
MVSACTGAVHSFAGLAVCRVVLGFTEAAFFPGVSIPDSWRHHELMCPGDLPSVYLLREEANGTSYRYSILRITAR